ncbi:MAG TPA: hypothetical protein VNS88_15675 [Nitrospiraceae bacterium]|nr:hypothetical protein [Nitrospiraceae bacterium]
MSETVTEPTGDADGIDQGAEGSQEDQDPNQSVPDEDDPAKLKEQIAHWRKMSRTHERAASRNSAAATKLAEIEEGQKSDLQKAEDARQAAERERDAANAQTNRMLAAAAHDLPTELIDYLGDGTSEEISERAEQLSGIIKAEVDKRIEALQPNGGRRQPTPRTVTAMRPGAAPASQGPGSPEQMFRQLIQPTD